MAGWTLRVGAFVLILSAVCALRPRPVQGETWEDIGPFSISFWGPTDGVDGAGEFDWGFEKDGTPRKLKATQAWTAEERRAVERAFEYWSDRLEESPDVWGEGRKVKIRVFWDVDGAEGGGNNAYSWSPETLSASGANRVTMAERSIAEKGNVAVPAGYSDLDGIIAFQPNSTTSYSSALNGPVPLSNRNIEAITIHELGHTLGYVSDANSDGDKFSDPLTVFDSLRLDAVGEPAVAGGPYDPDGFFVGPEAMKVFGDRVPIRSQGSHLDIDPLLMTHVRFRNYPFFTELELAVLYDLGYTTLDETGRKKFFGKSYYTDGGQGYGTDGDWVKDATFAVGVHVHANNRTITQSHNIKTKGTGATGIRLDGNNNVITLAPDATIEVSGARSAGIVASYGVGNSIIHRGTIIANSDDSQGILVDFGTNASSGGPQYDRYSGYHAVIDEREIDLRGYLVNAIDVSGSISARNGGNAIEIDDSAAVREINFMRGTDLNGDIRPDFRMELDGNLWCDALTNAALGLNAPTITFGFRADEFGRATSEVDPGFRMELDGNIDGSTPMTGILAGGTTVFNGTAVFDSLEIRPLAVLAGNGTVRTTVDNSGTIAPGESIGTLNIDGDLHNQAGSSIDVEIAPGGTTPGTPNDLLIVSGTTLFDGGTVNVQAALPGDYNIRDRYTFLTSGNGITVDDDTMPLFTVNLDTLRALPGYNAADFWFTLARDVPFAEIGQTRNQIGWGLYFDSAKDSDVAEIRQLRDDLDLMLDENEVRAAMDQMTGEIYGTLSILGIQSTTQFLRALATKMRTGPCEYSPETFYEGGETRGCVRDGWTVGYGLGGEGLADGNAHGVRYSNGGTILGLSGLTQTGVEFGTFYGYEMSHAKLEGVHSVNSGDTHRFGGYLNGCEGDRYLLLAMLFGFSQYDVQRWIAFDDYYATPTADHGGWQTALYSETGWLYEGQHLTVQPYAGLQYAYLGQDAFIESDGDVFNLVVDSICLHSLRSVSGVRLGSQPLRHGLRLAFDTVWWHEFLDPTTAQYSAAFAVADQWRFEAAGLDLGRDWFTVGPGLEWQVGNGSLFGKYEVMFNDQQAFHTGAGGVEWSW